MNSWSKLFLSKILGFILLWPTLVWAGWFHVFIPDQTGGYGKVGWPTTWTYFWGKPYQGVIADTKPPQFVVFSPSGKRLPVAVTAIDLLDESSGKKRRAFRLRYTAKETGDHYICLLGAPYLVMEEGLVYQDYVKECLHVFKEDGWQRPLGLELEIVPLTRPYGLEVGEIFRGRCLKDGQPAAGAKVEWEYYQGYYLPRKDLPQDPFGYENRPLITKSAHTDQEGIFAIGFNRPGWWIISVSFPSGTIDFGPSTFPLIKRTGIWIYVQEPYHPPPKKP